MTRCSFAVSVLLAMVVFTPGPVCGSEMSLRSARCSSTKSSARPVHDGSSVVLRRARAGHAHRGRRSNNGNKRRSGFARPFWNASSIAVRRPSGATRRQRSNGSIRSTAGRVIASASCVTKRLPGLWIPALLYEPENLTGKVPAILNVNGHTPLGKQYPPKQIRCINQAKRGMLALNIEWVGMGQLSGPGFDHYHMNQLDLCGTSGLAPYYLNMKRGLDVLLGLEHADPDRVAVTGLSGGGWQTIVISSLDTRVKLTNPVAGHSSIKTRVWHLKDLGDSEQMPNDLATICDYTHLTAMMAPRPTLLTFNLHDDCCFEGAYALRTAAQRGQPIFSCTARGRPSVAHQRRSSGEAQLRSG